MAKKKPSVVEQHLLDLLEADKTAEKKLTPRQKLIAIEMLAAEQARLRGDRPVEPAEKRAPYMTAKRAAAEEKRTAETHELAEDWQEALMTGVENDRNK